MEAVALTDHGRAGGLLQFKKACDKEGTKPIFGVELYMAPKSHLLKEKIEKYNTSYHLTVLAKNEEGLKNIFRLTSMGWIDGFYYKPRASTELLQEYSEGLVVLSGCSSGFIPSMLGEDRIEEAIGYLDKLVDIFDEDIYLEVQNHGIDWQQPLKKALFELSDYTGVPIVATQDSHFLELADADMHAKICKLAAGDLEFDAKGLHFKTYEEMLEMFEENEQHAIYRTKVVADKCNVDWQFGQTIWPAYGLPKGITSDKELQRKTEEGFKKRFPIIGKVEKDIGVASGVYRKRLNYELEVIQKMGFATYFLVVSEFIDWAKLNGIPVGPGRGCLTGETPVLMATGVTKSLHLIKQGDKIINRLGRPDTVVNCFKYAVKEELVKLKTYYGDYRGITLTKDHLVFGEKAQLVDGYETWTNSTQKARRKYQEPSGDIQEIPADKLDVGDWIFFPKIKVSIKPSPKEIDLVSWYARINKYPCVTRNGIIIEEVPTNSPFRGSIRDINRHTGVSRGAIKRFIEEKQPKKKSSRQENARERIMEYISSSFESIEEWRKHTIESRTTKRTVSRFIPINNEFFWVVGKWIADGWLRKNSERTWGICFHSENEQNQVVRMKTWLEANHLQYKEYLHATKKLVQIEVNSGPFCRWWKDIVPQYHYTSQTKHFPQFASSLSCKDLTQILRGYIEGDGTVEQGRVVLTTTSRTLVGQLKFILLRLGIPASIRFESRTDNREDFPDNQNSFRITAPIVGFLAELYPEKKTQLKYIWREIKDGVLCQIRSKEYIQQETDVYDISVKDDSSYLTTSGTVHNSGCGSIVCYSLGITEIDPIKYGLYFERFLNPARVSLPDLDIDFCKERRKEVLSHIVELYGREHVAQIGTYATFKPRGSLRDFARVCGYDPGIRNKLAALVPPDISGLPLTFDEVIAAEPKLLKTGQPEVVELARKAEGLKTKMGIHAAGVVVANRPLNELLPLFRGKHGEIASQFDMKDVEDLGLVKLDLLGLKNLTIIDKTIRTVKKNYGVNIDINKIDKDDQEVFTEIFQKGDLDGVFQFETSIGFRDLCVQIQPQSIKDLSVITALFRPGPLSLNLTNQYIKGQRGTEIEYTTPELEPILKETYGVVIYQEQVMRICVKLAGYTASEADDMRKAIGKKLKDKMAEHREKFVDGCINNNINQEVAEQLFNDIEGFSKYSFNSAHSIAYSVISYQTAWLKHYYPEEFYCALFNNTIREQDQLVKYIYSCKDKGIPVEPPDVNRSSSLFVVDHGTIIFGLAGIKGIGEKACDHLLSVRPEQGFKSLKELVMAKINTGVLKALGATGALSGVTELDRSTLMNSLDELMNYYKVLDRWEQRKIRWETREQEKKDAVAAGHKPPRSLPKLPPLPEEPKFMKETSIESISKSEAKLSRLSLERETLGFYLSGHPLDEYPGLYKIARFSIEKVKEHGQAGTSVKLPVVIGKINKKRTKKGNNMATLVLEDRTGRIEGTIFPRAWDKLKGRIEENQVAIALCKIDCGISADGETSIVRLVVDNIQSVSEKDKQEFSKPLITDIEIKLKDGSKIVFIPLKDSNYEQWQRAKAIANNLETIT